MGILEVGVRSSRCGQGGFLPADSLERPRSPSFLSGCPQVLGSASARPKLCLPCSVPLCLHVPLFLAVPHGIQNLSSPTRIRPGPLQWKLRVTQRWTHQEGPVLTLLHGLESFG